MVLLDQFLAPDVPQPINYLRSWHAFVRVGVGVRRGTTRITQVSDDMVLWEYWH
jgi:hypothetical protein